MKSLNEMSIKFLSRSSNEAFARAAVAAFAAQTDPTLEELNDIKTAVSEGVTNAIIHAYPDIMGVIWIRVRIFDENKVEITIRDRGVGIEDVELAREPMFTTGGEERSGMGFTIMENFMTNFRVYSKKGKGTTIKMVKHISCKATGGGIH
ncbi:MAG: anti-sigma F factor [Bacillota bacterium]|nr:anti-sigma F factor [Bacillota bacterium]